MKGGGILKGATVVKVKPGEVKKVTRKCKITIK